MENNIEKNIENVKNIKNIGDKKIIIGIGALVIVVLVGASLLISNKFTTEEIRNNSITQEEEKVMVENNLLVDKIEITFPGGGEILELLETQEIKWNCNNHGGSVDIFTINKNNPINWKQIGSSIKCSDERYFWNVKNLSIGEYKIMLKYITDNQDIISESDDFFRIVEKREEK